METNELSPNIEAPQEKIFAERRKRERDWVEGPQGEKAKEILGRDFLGVEAIQTLEDKLRQVGVNAHFELPRDPIPFSQKDIEVAKQHGEMLILRPGIRSFQKDASDTDFILQEFKELFRKDPLGNQEHLFDAFRISGYDGGVASRIHGDMRPGWAFVKKDVLEGSLGKSWNEQRQLLKQYRTELESAGAEATDARRRNLFETTWDTMLYYVNTGEHLLEKVYDWGDTRPYTFRDIGLSYAGKFDKEGGFDMYLWSPQYPTREDLGVCPTRS